MHAIDSDRASRGRRVRWCFVWPLLAAAAAVTARELPPIDAAASAPADPAADRAFASPPLAGLRGHMQRRLGIPTFVSAPRGAVRQSGASLLVVSDPAQIARSYLKSLATAYRISPSEVDALPVTRVQRLPNGAAIVQFGHTIGSVEVFRERASVLVDVDGSLDSIGGYVSGAGGIGRSNLQALFRRDAIDAIATALADFKFAPASARAALRSSAAHDGYEYFTLADHGGNGETLAQPARAKAVFFRTARGLIPAWYVEVHVAAPTTDDDSYYAYVVSAKSGTLLYRENLTRHDAYGYRVWAETTSPYLPYPGPQGRNDTPHPTATPDGYQAPFIAPNLLALTNALPNTSVAANDPWLAPLATQTAGNNVDAYADLDGVDGFSGSDYRASTTSANAFDRTYDVNQAAQASTGQVMASITQVFYLNNWLHDWYYDDGFDEAAGDAQQDNYGRGGVGGDRILAEVGNNPARDNANMSTPADGASPRMQMYVFDGIDAGQVIAAGQAAGSVPAGVAAFGPAQFDTGALQPVYVDDGVSAVHDGCDFPFANAVSGKIAVIDRGSCSFKTKVLNAQMAGAAGALIVNNVAGAAPPLGEDATIPTAITIASLSIDQDSGQAVETALSVMAAFTLQLLRTSPIDRDGAIDNTIVAHEWGHYISARLTPGLYASNMGAGMGEGFADFHALLMMVKPEDSLLPSNTDFAGTYAEGAYVGFGLYLAAPAQNSYSGLRRYPYSTDLAKSPLTYKYIADGVALPASPAPAAVIASTSANSEVHNTGEVWAAMLWQCYAALLNDTQRLTFAEAQDRMKRYLIAGYALQPVAPTFPEARDALLAAMYSQDPADYADCAAGFAARGLGAGAQSPDRYSSDNVGVVESFVANGAIARWVASDATDAGGSCDNDGVIDSLESGTVTLQLHNDGFAALDSATVSVSSPDGFVAALPQVPVAVPSLAPYATVSIPVPVQLGAVSGIQAMTLNYSVSDPLLVDAPLGGQALFTINADFVPAVTDDFESPVLAWTPASPDFSDPTQRWQRVQVAANEHVAFGPDNGSPGVTTLESPVLQVGSGNFTVTFLQNYAFETSDQYYDGGVIEVSTDGGASWHDVKVAGATLAPDYNGVIFDGSGNPLASRPAYVGSGSDLVTVDFGTALSNQGVKLRFVIGTDAAAGDAGWQIDDVSASGIANTPFMFRIDDPGHCVLNDRVFADGFDGQ
jgi:hypothetical protein